MASNIFVDSDVVIDFFTDREPFANPASEIFELNERGIAQIYLSAVSLNNIYYILRKHLGHPNALRVIEELLDITEIISTNKTDIIQALKNDFKDFEGSIQYACALKVESINAIITRNVKDYRSSEIAVFTSEQFLKTI